MATGGPFKPIHVFHGSLEERARRDCGSDKPEDIWFKMSCAGDLIEVHPQDDWYRPLSNKDRKLLIWYRGRFQQRARFVIPFSELRKVYEEEINHRGPASIAFFRRAFAAREVRRFVAGLYHSGVTVKKLSTMQQYFSTEEMYEYALTWVSRKRDRARGGTTHGVHYILYRVDQ